MKTQHKVLIALFLALLLVPSAVWLVFGRSLGGESRENRSLAAFPSVSETGAAGLPSAFDAWWNDHLPFKGQLTELHSTIFASLFNTTSDSRVLFGESGWLFYNNDEEDNPVNDILGRTTFTDAQMQAIAANIRAARQQWAEKDVQFVLMVPPNKETIYREYLPDYIRSIAVPQTRTDILYDYLTASGLDIVYPRDELLAGKAFGQLYYKYDTHWNRLGGYVGFSALCAQLGVRLPALSEYTIREADSGYKTDLAAILGTQDQSRDDLEYTIDFRPDVSVSSRTDDFGATVYTSDAPDARTVLLVHDSYYESMIDYFPRVFGTVISVPRNYADLYGFQALIERYGCDVVVMEVVERGDTLLLHENMPY